MVGFERVGHLVALSADVKPEVYKSLAISTTAELIVNFENYVKSQVHLNFTKDLFGRSLVRYVGALRFLRTNCTIYQEDACLALRWFYGDMANFLLHNLNDISLCVQVSEKMDLPVQEYSLKEVQNQLQTIQNDCSAEKIQTFPYSELLVRVADRRELHRKLHSCSVAAILLKEAKSNELHRVVIREDLE